MKNNVLEDWPDNAQKLQATPLWHPSLHRAVAGEFAGYTVVIGTGSAFHGQAMEFSDVDIYVVHDAFRSPRRKQLIVEKIPIQVSVMDLPGCLRLVSEARRSGDPFYVHALATGFHFLGPKPVAELIINYSKTVLKLGPDQQAPEKLEQMRISAANRYLRVLKSEAALPLITNAIDACRHAYRVASLEEGLWPHNMEREPQSDLAAFYHGALAQIANLAVQGELTEAKEILGRAFVRARINKWSTKGTVALGAGA